MSQFNPKRVLRQISPKLLKELFDRQTEKLDIPWGDESAMSVDAVFHAWQRMSDQPRKAIEVLFHDIDDMATGDDGMRVILEEGLNSGEDFRSVFEPMESRHDRALWTHLNHPRIWNTAVRFAEADGLSTGRFWIKRADVPKATPIRRTKLWRCPCAGYVCPSSDAREGASHLRPNPKRGRTRFMTCSTRI